MLFAYFYAGYPYLKLPAPQSLLEAMVVKDIQAGSVAR
jgi:hypothetical protein